MDDIESMLQGDSRLIIKVNTSSEAIEYLKNRNIGILITELHMDFEKNQNPVNYIISTNCDTYVIFVIDRNNLDNDIVSGLKQGAVDYLVKPISPEIAKAKIDVFERLFRKREILEEKNLRIQELLLNILPSKTAEELETTGKASVRSYKLATVLFTDFKGFTKITERMEPSLLLQNLNRFFSAFDYIMDSYYLEKIKTIGDAYMAVGGIPVSNYFNPLFSTLAALEIRTYMEQISKEKKREKNPIDWQLRIGLHSGPLIAGVVGKRKWQYDVWGDTVNTAARIESAGKPGEVNISGMTFEYIKDYFDCTYRGKIKAKYKGELDMYFVDRIKTPYAQDTDGNVPNDKLRKLLIK